MRTKVIELEVCRYQASGAVGRVGEGNFRWGAPRLIHNVYFAHRVTCLCP